MAEELDIIALDIDENLEDETCVFATGLVNHPAIERNWMTFMNQTKKKHKFVEPNAGENKDEFLPRCISTLINEGTEQEQAVAICYSKWENKMDSQLKFSAIEGEKQILAGPLMVADQPIYRYNEDTDKEYYVTFSAQAIEKIVNKLAKSNRSLTFNINHNDARPADKCYLVQSFIIDSTKGIYTPKGFDTLPDGSWFGFVKVDNDMVWEMAKRGEIKGFSIEGYFNEEKVGEATQQELENLKNKLLNMSKLNKENAEKTLGKELFAKIKSWFSEEATTTETETKVEEKMEVADVITALADGSGSIKGNIEVGAEVKLVAADGTESEVADGEYEIEGNKIITVAAGVITEVADKAEETTDTETETPATITPEDVTAMITEALAKQAAEFNAIIEKMNAENAEKMKAAFNAIEILASNPAEETVKEDPKRVSVNKRLEGFSKVMSIVNGIKK